MTSRDFYKFVQAIKTMRDAQHGWPIARRTLTFMPPNPTPIEEFNKKGGHL